MVFQTLVSHFDPKVRNIIRHILYVKVDFIFLYF
jgi:hypothetical protein